MKLLLTLTKDPGEPHSQMLMVLKTILGGLGFKLVEQLDFKDETTLEMEQPQKKGTES